METIWGRRMKIIEFLKNFFKLCKICDIGEFDDGYHSFNSLYYQRAILFATIVKANKDKSWKTYKHEDGSLCFGGGWFLVTVETPKGNYGYHFSNDYWHYFDCKEIENAKHWDGYTDADVDRLLFLNEYDNLKGIKMTLDEAIEHLEDSLKNKEFPCESCKEEHKQLLEWLKELKTFKEKTKNVNHLE